MWKSVIAGVVFSTCLNVRSVVSVNSLGETADGPGSTQPRVKKHSGRRAGPTNSHAVILETARAQFSEYGFDGTTMRGVAQAAEVDSALIHHFFLSKEALFLAA